jgi:hypothetical protein
MTDADRSINTQNQCIGCELSMAWRLCLSILNSLKIDQSVVDSTVRQDFRKGIPIIASDFLLGRCRREMSADHYFAVILMRRRSFSTVLPPGRVTSGFLGSFGY